MDIREYKTYDETEILGLYASVGWTAYTEQPESLRRGFEASLLVLAAYEDGALVGLIRVVGDGQTIVFVQDILVHPSCQRRGIGTALLKEVLKRYSHERFNGVRQIELTTDDTPKTRAFYESVGFRTMASLGCCGFMKM